MKLAVFFFASAAVAEIAMLLPSIVDHPSLLGAGRRKGKKKGC